MRTTFEVGNLTLAVLLFAPLLFATAACGVADRPAADQPAGDEAAETPGAAGGVGATAAPGDDAAAGAAADPAAPAGATGPPASAPAAVIAAQETNWPSVIAEINEFRRRGNTLTARVRFTNQGAETAEPDVHYDEVYLMDAAAGKKYEVLRDEEGTYIAGLRSGWKDRWYQKLEPGQTYTVWMKFPAPPPEVRTVTLQVPGMPPFEELPIQDS